MLSKTPSDSLFQVRQFSSLISQTLCKSGVAVGLTLVRLPPQSEWGVCVDNIIIIFRYDDKRMLRVRQQARLLTYLHAPGLGES